MTKEAFDFFALSSAAIMIAAIYYVVSSFIVVTVVAWVENLRKEEFDERTSLMFGFSAPIVLPIVLLIFVPWGFFLGYRNKCSNNS